MPDLTTDRLHIRPLSPADRDAYFEIFSDPSIAALDDYTPVLAEEKDEDFAAANPDEVLSVCLRDNGEVVGMIHYPLTDGVPWIGYHFLPRHQGRGYVREAMRALLDSGLLGRDPHGCVDERNGKSIRILEELGFVRIGERPNLAGFRDWVYRLGPSIDKPASRP